MTVSHTFSDSSHTLHDDLAVQMDEAVLLEHCPHPSEQQSQSAERRSVQKKCEKSGLAGIAEQAPINCDEHGIYCLKEHLDKITDKCQNGHKIWCGRCGGCVVRECLFH
jgi:hypothetical protein